VSATATATPAAGLPGYAPTLLAYHRAFGRELRELIAGLPLRPGDRVLDLACSVRVGQAFQPDSGPFRPDARPRVRLESLTYVRSDPRRARKPDRPPERRPIGCRLKPGLQPRAATAPLESRLQAESPPI
jgi:hypothetical protein